MTTQDKDSANKDEVKSGTNVDSGNLDKKKEKDHTPSKVSETIFEKNNIWNLENLAIEIIEP